MPSRMAESILNTEMNMVGKETSESRKINELDMNYQNFPFLAIETDGNLFPQIIQSKIEIFMLQTERLHKQISKSDKKVKQELLVKFKNSIDNYLKRYYRQPANFINEKEDIATETE